MQNNNTVTVALALIAPNSRQILNPTDRALAAAEVTSTGNTIWFDADKINRGTVLWGVPGAGWVITTQVGDVVVVLQAREDGSPIRGNHLNRIEVGLGRPSLNQHWECIRACLVAK